MLANSLLALAGLAGRTLVAAAATDAWDTAERGFARLLGRGDARRTQLMEQRLEETRKQLRNAAGTDAEHVRSVLAERWAERLTDLLEENPETEAGLHALVQRILAALPANVVPAADRAATAKQLDGRAAEEWAVGAVIYGTHESMPPPNPTLAGLVAG